MPVLAHRKPRKLDPWACVARLRGFGIERLVDVRANLFRVRADTLLGHILGHRLGDEPDELSNRPLTRERAGVAFVRSLAHLAVAPGTLLPINLCTGSCFGPGGRDAR